MRKQKKQTVGWDYIVLVLMRGKVKVSGVEAELSIDLPFAGEGARKQCPCNEQLNPDEISFDEDTGEGVRIVPDTTRQECSFLVPLNQLEQLGTIKLSKEALIGGGFVATEVEGKLATIATLSPDDLELPPLSECDKT